MEAYLLAGLAHRQLGDQRAANQAAEHALALAEQDRVILPFAMTGTAGLLEALPWHQTAHGGCRTRGCRGFRRVGVPDSSVRQQAQRPGELDALGGQLVGGPGQPLRVGPGTPAASTGHRPWPAPRQAGDEPFSRSAMSGS
jgi:hypothetical protein